MKIVNRSSNPDNAIHLVPFFIKISRGDTVIWKNEDVVIHTITSGTLGGKIPASYSIPVVSLQEKLSNIHSRNQAESTTIIVRLHPFITGEVNVS